MGVRSAVDMVAAAKELGSISDEMIAVYRVFAEGPEMLLTNTDIMRRAGTVKRTTANLTKQLYEAAVLLRYLEHPSFHFRLNPKAPSEHLRRLQVALEAKRQRERSAA